MWLSDDTSAKKILNLNRMHWPKRAFIIPNITFQTQKYDVRILLYNCSLAYCYWLYPVVDRVERHDWLVAELNAAPHMCTDVRLKEASSFGEYVSNIEFT